jgi:hypothetical protein
MFKKAVGALSFAVSAITATAWLQSFLTRRRAQRKQQESIDKARWESEGGATRPAPPPSNPQANP